MIYFKLTFFLFSDVDYLYFNQHIKVTLVLDILHWLSLWKMELGNKKYFDAINSISFYTC